MKLTEFVKTLFNLAVKQYRKKQAIMLANAMHKADNKRYMVMPSGNYFHVLNNHAIARINRKNRKKNRLNFVDCMNNAIYVTK